MVFSVIVPFLNEERYILQCVTSLLSQDFDKNEYELIFVDNGSTDKSGEIVNQFKEIILLRESKRSPYAARNKGLGIARGEIIAFTDADCAVERDWLTQIFYGMHSSGADIILGKVNFSSLNSAPLRLLEEYVHVRNEYVLTNHCQKYYYGYTNNMAVRSRVFKQVGRFNYWLRSADTEIIHRYLVACADNKIVYLPKMKITHLEVSKVSAWLKKLFIHGRYNVLSEQFTDYRPLNFRHRLYISSLCASKNKYRLGQGITFFILRIWGFIFYETGRAVGKICSLK